MKQLSLFADDLLAARKPPREGRGLRDNDLPPAPVEDLADRRQRAATEPRTSVWVGASAGTGKTKVLTDRALRLMLSGTPPSKILCLTFTKAAAAEMASRIATVLGGWANAAEADLNAALVSLMGRPPKDRERTRARSLFPAVLDAPGGLKVLTIHAFCQSLLGRFPLEAGVAPHFSVMDERDAAEALAEVGEALLLQAQAGKGTVASAFATVTAHLQETRFRSLMQTLACARDRMAGCLAHYGSAEAATMALRRHLGIGEDETAERVIETACNDAAFDRRLRGAPEALACGSEADRKRGVAIAVWLAADTQDRVDGWNDYRDVYVTKKGEVRKKLITKACGGSTEGFEAVLAAEADRVVATSMRRRAALCADTSGAVLTLAETLLAAYRRHKAARALLDYDDLIEHAAALLEQDGGAAWVLYKLDGGIDHILIDEAQDTSPQQWRVIRALTAEFFAGHGRAEAPRTVFAVGDVKQSIFSFQGADPSLFLDNGRRFEALSAEAAQRWDRVDLTVSFRSTKAVLAAVDAVFRLDEARDGVALDGAPIRHDVSTRRAGDGGLVEVWEPLRARPDDEPEPWRPPVERVESDSPKRRFARVIAGRIGAMLRGGELLESKGRPVRPEDILVLVRRREGFVEELVRALKARGVPVAGVDRMVLSEQIAVMDLIALGRFVLLPDDDLNLAGLLKSPLVGLDEDDLFALAHGRGKASLWSELRRRRDERPRFMEAHDLLAGLLADADTMPPFEFYTRALGPLDGRRRLLARLGQDADDPIAEFLDLALDYERRHPPSLEGFLHWFETGEAIVKRDLEQAPAAVRIMTVHGAKGLQAPIVFLPDTMQVPRANGKDGVELLWTDAGDGVVVPLWAPSANGCEEIATRARAGAKAEQLREYRRLLYVAMTRAEDRLIVCGWIGRTNEQEECWYRTIRRGLEANAAEIGCERVQDDGLAESPDFDADPTVLRLRCPQASPVAEMPAGAPPVFADLPRWASTAAADEKAPAPLVPSMQAGAPKPLRSPAAESLGLKRGRLIHTLLQWLPDVAADRRRSAADAWLAASALDLEPAARTALIDEVLAVLDHPDHAALFAPGSLAEVPIGGVIGERLLSAQVDRLVVTEDAVTIVDYKTDRPAPGKPEAVPGRYLAQMAAYRAALRLIYPGRTVRCALLWSDLPSLMLLPDPLLDRHAP